MLRVARIVPEFCARGRPKNRATPCAVRNREFLARGVLSNKPNPCRYADREIDVPGRAIASNKPNLGGGKSRDKCLAGKELW